MIELDKDTLAEIAGGDYTEPQRTLMESALRTGDGHLSNKVHAIMKYGYCPGFLYRSLEKLFNTYCVNRKAKETVQ